MGETARRWFARGGEGWRAGEGKGRAGEEPEWDAERDRARRTWCATVRIQEAERAMRGSEVAWRRMRQERALRGPPKEGTAGAGGAMGDRLVDPQERAAEATGDSGVESAGEEGGEEGDTERVREAMWRMVEDEGAGGVGEWGADGGWSLARVEARVAESIKVGMGEDDWWQRVGAEIWEMVGLRREVVREAVEESVRRLGREEGAERIGGRGEGGWDEAEVAAWVEERTGWRAGVDYKWEGLHEVRNWEAVRGVVEELVAEEGEGGSSARGEGAGRTVEEVMRYVQERVGLEEGMDYEREWLEGVITESEQARREARASATRWWQQEECGWEASRRVAERFGGGEGGRVAGESKTAEGAAAGSDEEGREYTTARDRTPPTEERGREEDRRQRKSRRAEQPAEPSGQAGTRLAFSAMAEAGVTHRRTEVGVEDEPEPARGSMGPPPPRPPRPRAAQPQSPSASEPEGASGADASGSEMSDDEAGRAGGSVGGGRLPRVRSKKQAKQYRRRSAEYRGARGDGGTETD